MSEETRAKMSQAKINRTVPKDVRRKMSASHQGKKHTPETASLLSAKLRGRSKSAEHRMAIAAAQRKRHAAARVLKAIENVHRQSQAEGMLLSTARDVYGGPTSIAVGAAYHAAHHTSHTGSLGTPKLPTSPAALGPSKRGRPKIPPPPPSGSKGQMLEAYKLQLREYKALQEELAPWVKAFEQQAGRKPKLTDVEATRIPWLLEKYKKYVVLRERVMLDTTGVRGMLGGSDAAQPEAPAVNGDSVGARMAAAMAYRAARCVAVVVCTIMYPHTMAQCGRA